MTGYVENAPLKIPVRSSDIIGVDVINEYGENCGCIAEIIIHKNYGEIAYLLLSYPGHYGTEFAEKLFAVPYDSFVMDETRRKEKEFLLHVSEDFLKKAPGFPKNTFPDFADPRFVTEHQQYYKGLKLDVAV